jgi:hypothetical protein
MDTDTAARGKPGPRCRFNATRRRAARYTRRGSPGRPPPIGNSRAARRTRLVFRITTSPSSTSGRHPGAAHRLRHGHGRTARDVAAAGSVQALCQQRLLAQSAEHSRRAASDHLAKSTVIGPAGAAAMAARSAAAATTWLLLSVSRAASEVFRRHNIGRYTSQRAGRNLKAGLTF